MCSFYWGCDLFRGSLYLLFLCDDRGSIIPIIFDIYLIDDKIDRFSTVNVYSVYERRVRTAAVAIRIPFALRSAFDTTTYRLVNGRV